MRIRPLLHASLALAASIVLLEALSFFSGTILLGRGFLARTRQERAHLSSAGLDAPGDIELPSSLRAYVLHPYLGFVADAETTAGPAGESEGRVVPTELGFFRRRDAVAAKTLVNLDGFNEVTLPVSENLAQGTAPIYPRSWSLLAAASASTALPEAAADRSGDIALRRMLAQAFSAPVLRQSGAGALLWKLLDDALATRIAALDSGLAARLDTGIPAALRGPTFALQHPDDPLPELARLWRESSRLMQQICQANGIAYVHALHPNQYVPASKPLAPSELGSAFRPDHPYRSLVERGYPLLVEQGRVLAASGVRFVDLSMVFAAEREPVYVDDCCHFGTRGNLLVAGPIAAAVSAALAR